MSIQQVIIKNIFNVLLILLVFLSFSLRVINIQNVPSGFNWDEAALGYNAYSILKTGRDEYGELLPLVFKSFGDYKPGFYVYLAVPFVAIFGLTEFATRLPSIIIGSLIPLVGYLLIRQFFPQEKKTLALLVAFFLAISPWAINFSRGAWETNVAFFEALLGVYFFIRARDGRKLYLILSFLLFSLSLYTYQSAKILSSSLVLGLVIIYREEFLRKGRRFLVLGLVIFLFLVLLTTILDSNARSRLVVLNQFNYTRSNEQINVIKKEEDSQDLFIFNLFHSEYLEQAKIVLSRYLYFFSPSFLFISAAPDGRQGAVGYGVMHLIEFPFFLLGVYVFFKRYLRQGKPLLLWAILSPIPSALSRDSVNTVRALPLAFSLEVFSAIGLYFFLSYFKKWVVPVFGVILLLIFFNLGFFFDIYFVHSRIHTSSDWLYGYKQAVSYITEHKDKYNKVVMTTGYNEPYIFYLFYSQYQPSEYQKQAVLSLSHGVDVGEVNRIDNIEFRPIYWPNDRGQKNILYIGRWIELPLQDIDPKESKLLETIYFLDETVAFRIIETNER